MDKNKLACPLAEGEIEVPESIIAFLEKHYYIDVFKNGKYLFTLQRRPKKPYVIHDLELERRRR